MTSDWTPLHSCISVLKDVYDELILNRDEDDMSPDKRDDLIDEIESALAIKEISDIYTQLQTEETE